MRYFVATAIVLLLALAAPSCSDNPASSNSMKGTLTLVTVLIDQDANRLSDNSGVTATIDGTTRSAVSDADGFILFPDLPAGTYVITFTKPGYSTFKIFGAQFVGGGTSYIRDNYITEIPNYAIEQFTARIDTESSVANDYVTVAGKASDPAPETNDRTFRVFFDTTNSVSPTKFVSASSILINAGHTDFQRLATLQNLRAAGIGSGKRVYAVAYPASVWTLGYFDPTKRKWVEANLSPQGTPVTSFVMP